MNLSVTEIDIEIKGRALINSSMEIEESEGMLRIPALSTIWCLS